MDEALDANNTAKLSIEEQEAWRINLAKARENGRKN